MTREALLDRVTSLCVGYPFAWTRAVSPFDFDHQPSGSVDACVRVEVETDGVIGGFAFSEERTDRVTFWVARHQAADPQATYRRLMTDISSLTSAVVHDGATGGGDYAVLDGAEARLEHDNGLAFAVARLSLPINYETTV